MSEPKMPWSIRRSLCGKCANASYDPVPDVQGGFNGWYCSDGATDNLRHVTECEYFVKSEPKPTKTP
jgi:hypothetical protein